jgi:NAD(P)H-flavin reductase
VIEMTHPLGKGFDLDRAAGKPVCLVGTGTGVAPVRAALEALLSEGASPTSLSLDHGLRSEAHLAVGDAVAVWRAAGVTVRISFSTLEEGQLVGTTVQDTLFAARTDFTGVAMVAVGQNALLADLRARFEAAGGLREDFLTNV